jgi:hypothetical protein
MGSRWPPVAKGAYETDGHYWALRWRARSRVIDASPQIHPDETEELNQTSPRCFRTMVLIRLAATLGSSCSQTRTTRQPSVANRSSVCRSRTSFFRSFSFHHFELDFGLVR